MSCSTTEPQRVGDVNSDLSGNEAASNGTEARLLPVRDSARQPSLSALLRAKTGGAEGIRTPDLLIANETLYQLSYDPSLAVRTIMVLPQKNAPRNS
jgi:hypothetical protein